MSKFKILGVKPLDGTFSKILTPNEIYYLSNKYSFITDIKDQTEKPILNELYVDNHGIYDIGEISVNISAVVGKNGSGKSSLLELIYAFSFVVAKQKKDLTHLFPDQKTNKNIPSKINELLSDLRMEIYYELDNEIYKLSRKKKNVLCFKFANGSWRRKVFNNFKYFYSIVINYSLYGLNELDYPWLWALFHKNDGYKAPIVINPMRRKGIIDSNLEYSLAQSRLLTNLLVFKNNRILPNRSVKFIELKFKPNQLNSIWFNGKERAFSSIVASFKQFENKDIVDYFNELFFNLFKLKLNEDEISFFKELTIKDNSFLRESTYYTSLSEITFDAGVLENNLLRYFTFKYSIKKIFKILLT